MGQIAENSLVVTSLLVLEVSVAIGFLGGVVAFLTRPIKGEWLNL